MINKYIVNYSFLTEFEAECGEKAQELARLEFEKFLDQTEKQLKEIGNNVCLKKRQFKVEKVKQIKFSKLKLAEFKFEDIFPYLQKKFKKQYQVGEQTHEVRMDSLRYFVFKNSLVCAACGLQTTKVFLEINLYDKSPHFNFYAEEDGKLILMTRDHILPKSKGGRDELSNLQCHCCICNNLKGNNDLTNLQVAELRKIYNENKKCLTKKKLAQLIKSEKIKLRGF
jgi:HNH endonuclease